MSKRGVFNFHTEVNPQFSEIGKQDSASDPDFLYYNGSIINNSTNTTQTTNDPQVQYQDTRSLPILKDKSKYAVSVENFSLNGAGKVLPLFIPQIRQFKGTSKTIKNTNPNNTIYDVTFTWQYVPAGESIPKVFQSTRSVQWVAQNQAAWTVQPPAVYTYPQLEIDYYYCYSYSWWLKLVNSALEMAWGDVKLAVETFSPSVKFGTKCPYYTYDEKTNLFSLHQDANSALVPYGDTPGSALATATSSQPPNPQDPYGAASDSSYSPGEYCFVGWNTNWDNLLSNFNTVYYSDGVPYPYAGLFGTRISSPNGTESCGSAVEISSTQQDLVTSFVGNVLSFTPKAGTEGIKMSEFRIGFPYMGAEAIEINGPTIVNLFSNQAHTIPLLLTTVPYLQVGIQLLATSLDGSVSELVTVSAIGGVDGGPSSITVTTMTVLPENPWVFTFPSLTSSSVTTAGSSMLLDIGQPFETFPLLSPGMVLNTPAPVTFEAYVEDVTMSSISAGGTTKLYYSGKPYSFSPLQTYSNQNGTFAVGDIVKGLISDTQGEIVEIVGPNVTSTATSSDVSALMTVIGGPFYAGDTLTRTTNSCRVVSVSGVNSAATLVYSGQKNIFKVGDSIQDIVTNAYGTIEDIIGENTGYATLGFTNQNGSFGNNETVVGYDQVFGLGGGTIISVTGENTGYAQLPYINEHDPAGGLASIFTSGEYLTYLNENSIPVAFAQVIIDNPQVNTTSGNNTLNEGYVTVKILDPASLPYFSGGPLNVTGSLSGTIADVQGINYPGTGTLLLNNISGSFYVGNTITDIIGDTTVTAQVQNFNYLSGGTLKLKNVVGTFGINNQINCNPNNSVNPIFALSNVSGNLSIGDVLQDDSTGATGIISAVIGDILGTQVIQMKNLTGDFNPGDDFTDLSSYTTLPLSGNSSNGVFSIGDSVECINGSATSTTPVHSTNLIVGNPYQVLTTTTTTTLGVWQSLGAGPGYIGNTFTASINGIPNTLGVVSPPIPSVNLVVGTTYQIYNPSSTDWIALGAANKNAGTTFMASSPEIVGTVAKNLSITSPNLIKGTKYQILVAGGLDWTTVGSANSVVGTVFIATKAAPIGSSGTVNPVITANNLVIGTTYTIITIGTTNFMTLGATDNNIGTLFVATGYQSIGTAFSYSQDILQIGPSYLVTGYKYEIFIPGNFDWTLVGATDSNIGTKFIATAPYGTNESGKALQLTNSVIFSENILAGTSYMITLPGNTDWSSVGANGTALGVSFYATGNQSFTLLPTGTALDLTQYDSTKLIVGQEYKISLVGTTDWTELGAADNDVGTIFIATAKATNGSASGSINTIDSVTLICDTLTYGDQAGDLFQSLDYSTSVTLQSVSNGKFIYGTSTTSANFAVGDIVNNNTTYGKGYISSIVSVSELPFIGYSHKYKLIITDGIFNTSDSITIGALYSTLTINSRSGYEFNTVKGSLSYGLILRNFRNNHILVVKDIWYNQIRLNNVIGTIPIGPNYAGQWNLYTEYPEGTVVSYLGINYQALVDIPISQTPPYNFSWKVYDDAVNVNVINRSSSFASEGLTGITPINPTTHSQVFPVFEIGDSVSLSGGINGTVVDSSHISPGTGTILVNFPTDPDVAFPTLGTTGTINTISSTCVEVTVTLGWLTGGQGDIKYCAVGNIMSGYNAYYNFPIVAVGPAYIYNSIPIPVIGDQNYYAQTIILSNVPSTVSFNTTNIFYNSNQPNFTYNVLVNSNRLGTTGTTELLNDQYLINSTIGNTSEITTGSITLTNASDTYPNAITQTYKPQVTTLNVDSIVGTFNFGNVVTNEDSVYGTVQNFSLNPSSGGAGPPIAGQGLVLKPISGTEFEVGETIQDLKTLATAEWTASIPQSILCINSEAQGTVDQDLGTHVTIVGITQVPVLGEQIVSSVSSKATVSDWKLFNDDSTVTSSAGWSALVNSNSFDKIQLQHLTGALPGAGDDFGTDFNSAAISSANYLFEVSPGIAGSSWTISIPPLTSSDNVTLADPTTITTNLSNSQTIFDAGNVLSFNLLNELARQVQLFLPENVAAIEVPQCKYQQLIPGPAFVNSPLSSPAWYLVMVQDFESTSSLWSPVASIVISTTFITVREEYSGTPITLGTGNLGGNATTSSFQKVLLEVPVEELPQIGYKGLIQYRPQVETLSSLGSSHSELKNIDVLFQWRNRLTNSLIPLELSNSGSATIRLLFKKIRD